MGIVLTFLFAAIGYGIFANAHLGVATGFLSSREEEIKKGQIAGAIVALLIIGAGLWLTAL